MDVRQLNQRRPVDADDRPIAQQELEAGRAVVGDHQVGRDEVRGDVVTGGDHAAPRREERLQPRHPVDAARVSLAQIARSVVQLDDQVDRQPQQAGDELDADGVQRRGGRPRRRVEDRRPRRIESERQQDGGRGRCCRRPGSRPSACRSAGSPGCRRSIAPAATKLRSRRSLTKNSRCHSRIDRVGASNPYLPPTPWKTWMRRVPRGSDAHMKSDATYASNFIKRGAARMDRPHARGLAVDRGHARRLLAGGEVELHARVALDGADDGRHHREVDRRPAVDEDPAVSGPPADPRVEPTECRRGRRAARSVTRGPPACGSPGRRPS